MRQQTIFSIFLLLVCGRRDGSVECKHGSSMGRDSMDSFAKSCVNITYPTEAKTIATNCLKTTVMNGTLLQDLMQGKFPDKPRISEFINNLQMCQFRDSGIPNPETQIDLNGFLKASMIDKWTGDQTDINMFREKMTSCFNSAQGTTTMEKLNSSYKCLVQSLIDYCTTKGGDPGMMLTMASNLLTITDTSPCAVVKIPQNVIDIGAQCMAEAKANMNTTLPDEVTKTQDPVKKLKKIGKLFMKEFLMKVMMCCALKQGFYDNTTNTVKTQAVADYIMGFVGWDSIPQQKDEVYKAIIECSKVFAMNDTSTSSSQEDDDDMMKDMMMKKLDYEKCFIPKFAKSCGMNSDIANFMFPFLDAKFMGELFNVFMAFGQQEANSIMDMLKPKM